MVRKLGLARLMSMSKSGEPMISLTQICIVRQYLNVPFGIKDFNKTGHTVTGIIMVKVVKCELNFKREVTFNHSTLLGWLDLDNYPWILFCQAS